MYLPTRFFGLTDDCLAARLLNPRPRLPAGEKIFCAAHYFLFFFFIFFVMEFQTRQLVRAGRRTDSFLIALDTYFLPFYRALLLAVQ